MLQASEDILGAVLGSPQQVQADELALASMDHISGVEASAVAARSFCEGLSTIAMTQPAEEQQQQQQAETASVSQGPAKTRYGDMGMPASEHTEGGDHTAGSVMHLLRQWSNPAVAAAQRLPDLATLASGNLVGLVPKAVTLEDLAAARPLRQVSLIQQAAMSLPG
jgi:hypothetical protein